MGTGYWDNEAKAPGYQSFMGHESCTSQRVCWGTNPASIYTNLDNFIWNLDKKISFFFLVSLKLITKEFEFVKGFNYIIEIYPSFFF